MVYVYSVLITDNNVSAADPVTSSSADFSKPKRDVKVKRAVRAPQLPHYTAHALFSPLMQVGEHCVVCVLQVSAESVTKFNGDV